MNLFLTYSLSQNKKKNSPAQKFYLPISLNNCYFVIIVIVIFVVITNLSMAIHTS